jgi:hypothetical protein
MKRFELRGRFHRVLAIIVAAAAAGVVSVSAANNGKGQGKDNGNAGGGAAAAASYSGRAIAVRIDGDSNGPIVISDTGALPSAGGHLAVSTADVNLANGGLKIDSADAEANGEGNGASAEARITGFRAEIVMTNFNTVIEADYIASSANVTADQHGALQAAASVQIDNLRVNGQSITVTGQPNQVVDLPDIDTKLIINEQANAGGESSGDIAMVGLHFWACDIEGLVGEVSAGMTVTGSPPPPQQGDCGKVTGGGWISGTPSGDKGTFGMSGGIRRGEFWGHLTYQDHATGMKVQSTAVTNFDDDPSDFNGRMITYAVTIDGQPGTAQLRVVDNGEPGRDDIFDLTLSNGYHAAGDLGGAHPGGGNIQVHKCPPGWE